VPRSDAPVNTRRRAALRAAAGALFVGTTTARVAGRQTDDVEPEVRFEDQTTDGDTIVIEAVRSDRSSSLLVTTRQGKTVAGKNVRFAAGDTAEDLELPLDGSLEGSQSLLATLFESNGGPIAEDSATVTVKSGSTGDDGTNDESSEDPEKETDEAETNGWMTDLEWPEITQIGAVASIGSAAYLLGGRTGSEGESSEYRE